VISQRVNLESIKPNENSTYYIAGRIPSDIDSNLGTNWLVGRGGLNSGCTMKSMCGKPVPK